jgi:hypothetical protein
MTLMFAAMKEGAPPCALPIATARPSHEVAPSKEKNFVEEAPMRRIMALERARADKESRNALRN